MKLVSAVLPTRGRRELAAIALRCFLSQTYQNKEIVILDDADDPSFPNWRDCTNVIFARAIGRYFRINQRLNIPQKRNWVNGMAQGEILMHFDSDDWSAPGRMADQVRRLEESGKAVTGYSSMLFHDDRNKLAAKYENVANFCALGTSLCYTREWWKANPFDERLDTMEDNLFVRVARDARQLSSVDAGDLMVARVHPGNTDPKSIRAWPRKTTSDLPEGYRTLSEIEAVAQ